jgi:hypothetical protein
MKNLLKILSLLTIAGFILTACEGPMGPQGEPGTNGTNGTNGVDGKDGKDANETCKLCHNATSVEAIAIEYHYSMHAKGEAYEEGTRNNCAPCHSHQGFLNVVAKNTPVTFAGPDASNRYANSYVAEASVLNLPGPISCFTCHSSLHTNYEGTEFSPLTTIAAVPMTMYGGSKTIDFAKESGNLCGKCHQPRPVTGSNGNVIDYGKLVSEHATTYTLSSISYRTGVHYGTQAAMAAGTGGIEFGTGYTQSAHVAGASCNSCHMASPTGLAGGHSFKATGNFKGCNATGCHTTMSATNATFTATQTEIKNLLEDLADKINAIGAGHDILQLDPADGHYHGYFDIYDASANPTGYWRNPANGTPAFPALTNAQFGAIINYQLAYRDGSKGVHNGPYIKTLLTNSLAAW